MRSTLKKSLYLGLAALSFASVAGAANNADAAKKTKPAKTYATASYQPIADQGQSNIAYNVTGSNALFNKPGTVQGAKQTASKATMSDLASSKQNFMVYQTATTNRGSKYIKVVSFDKQYRGWIYAGNNTSSGYGTGVQRINLTTPATAQSGNLYLKAPGATALKSSPESGQFNASTDNFSHTGFVANDAFNVDQAQTVSKTGTTWYHLVDQKDNTISGWVPSNQVQTSSDNGYFNNRTQVKVNYTSNGQIVKSNNIDVGSVSKDSNGILNAGQLATAINNVDKSSNSNSVLNGSGYTLPSDNSGEGLNGSSSESYLQYAETGDTINVPVNGGNTNNVSSGFTFNVTNGINGASPLSSSNYNSVSVSKSDLSNQVNGMSSRQGIDMNLVLGDYTNSRSGSYSGKNLFNPQSGSNQLGVLYGTTNSLTNTSNTPIYNAVSDDSTVKTNAFGNLYSNMNQTINNQDKFHYDYVLDVPTTMRANQNSNYGQNINLYYTQVAVKDSVAGTNSGNVNF